MYFFMSFSHCICNENGPLKTKAESFYLVFLFEPIDDLILNCLERSVGKLVVSHENILDHMC